MTTLISDQLSPEVGQHSQLRNRSSTYNGNKYDRIRVLGKGSFGTAAVYRRHLDYSLVVLKEIDLNKFKGERDYISAINEARIMSTLDHSNIIKYHNAYLKENKLIIEMEYASLGSLSAYLSLQAQVLDECEVLVIFRQIASGLAYLHSKNIIHLDLKMANIFVTCEGLVKIGDFGIAQFLDNDSDYGPSHIKSSGGPEESSKAPTASSHLGTLAYSSPERCLGQTTDYKSDIWSLGCILYELITSQQLFAARSLAELVLVIAKIQYIPIERQVSPDLRQMFEQTIERHPADRPSALEVLAKTDDLLSRIQADRHQASISAHKRNRSQASRRLIERSTELALFANENYTEDLTQVNYFHSIVYQIRLDERPIRVDRVNLPQSKRIKEIVKGRSHYLVLTYDNIVYGWGSRQCGQLGACGLANVQQYKMSRFGSRPARESLDANLPLVTPESSAATSPASSNQTLALSNILQSPSLSARRASYRRFVRNALKESHPTQKPFVINELNHRKIVQVAAGNDFSVFLSKTGLVMTCGDGSTGCLGRGDWSSSFKPCMVEGLLDSDVVSISCGPKHVVAVCGNGRAYSWGKTSCGRLGIGRIAKQMGANGPETLEYILSPTEVDLPHHTIIKSVICGDKCTVFTDANNKTWACGQNRCNKLGLDRKRRFKKPVHVEIGWSPAEVEPLRKFKILTCSIAKNHASYLSLDGRLVVLGEDIDYSYHLQNADRSRYRECSRSSGAVGLQESSNRSVDGVTMFSNGLGKLSKRHVESIIKKSRAPKKMSFEFVVSTSCTAKFTLALTSDNRVYFWGTRTYLTGNDISGPSHLTRTSIEPQLISCNNTDEQCFVKIGTTNNSLMCDIEALGSDQPIIHAQDPHLVVRSLSDLWILDYKPSPEESSCSSCSPSTCSGSSSCSISACNYASRIDNFKHDAILEPQPILSLYKPSMFNNKNSTLNFVELFSFDEDCFYVVLDTSIRLQSPPTRAGSQQLRADVNDSASERAASSCGNKSPAALNQQTGFNFSQSGLLEQPILENQMCKEDRGCLAEVPEVVLVETSQENQDSPSIATLVDRNVHVRSDNDIESNSGLSLEEPRSLSTFANSTSNHILVAPTMRSHDQQPMHPLAFDHGQPNGLDTFTLSGMNLLNRRKRRWRRTLNRSESTTNNEHDETSSMPSWVRNEFIEHQQENQSRANDQMLGCISSGSSTSMISVLGYDEASTVVTSDASHHDDGTLEASLNSRPIVCALPTSRSHPDLSNTSSQTYNIRRASIKETATNEIGNILDCEVYRASTAPLRSAIYQSTSSSDLNMALKVHSKQQPTTIETADNEIAIIEQARRFVTANPAYSLTNSCNHLDHLSLEIKHSSLTSSQPICLQNSKVSPLKGSNLSLSSLRRSFVRLFCS